MDGCETMEVWLSLRLDGMLEPEEERELEAHLAVCPRCRALAQELEAVHTAFPQLEDCSAPEGFAQGVMDRIRALEPEPAPAEGPEDRKEETEPTEMPKVVPLHRPMPRWARTAAALAACGALVLLRGNLAVLYDAVEQAEKQKKQKLIAGMSHDLKSPPDLYPGL